MKFWTGLLLALLLLGAVNVAHADSPTATSTPVPSATPTLLPIAPTATSPYLYLRPTPTALALDLTTYSIDLHTDPGPMADTAINIYRSFNQGHILDYVMFMAVVGVAVLYLIRIIARTTKDE